MATPIPAFVSQILSSGETISVNGSSPSELSRGRYYYLVSNRTAASNGQSLLRALKDQLDAVPISTVWTVTLALHAASSTYRVNLAHNNASSRTITLPTAFALKLGFASGTIVVAASTTKVADYPSSWWWTPDMPISGTGPSLFDPAINAGIEEASGGSARAPDSTAVYTHNGFLTSAEYLFNAVAYYYKIHPQVGYENQDLKTWWKNGPGLGRRFLMWRDRSNATGSNAPSEGATSPYNYVEYTPQEVLKGTFPAKESFPDNLFYWNVKLACWLTPNGETPLSD
jgi:hypothetical protein